MVDTSALVLAIISLVGTLIITTVTIVFQYFSDERKRLSETERLVRKYRDPVLWAANELQSRLYNICWGGSILDLARYEERHDLTVIYTAYLIGQYFAWTGIFRRKAQFLSFASKGGKEHKKLNDLLVGISNTFLSSHPPLANAPFNLWRGEQSAIAELMTVKEEGDDGEYLCMGYATFATKYKEDEKFRAFFKSITRAVEKAASLKRHERRLLRLMYLQHLLFELMQFLDPEGVQWDKKQLKPIELSEEQRRDCSCVNCQTAGVTVGAAKRTDVEQGEGEGEGKVVTRRF